MAGVDWGVIALKNGKLMPEQYGVISQGTGGTATIGPVVFDRTEVFRSVKDFADYFFDDGDFHGMGFANELYLQNKYVLHWQQDNIQFKTKRIENANCYLTTFKYQGDFYRVLQGYDISLTYCNEAKTVRLVNKFCGVQPKIIKSAWEYYNGSN